MSEADADTDRQGPPPSGAGCLDCEQASPPTWWFHLRRCVACGHVGCCDSSVGQHGTAHARASGHTVIASFEPGEDWCFDYGTEEVAAAPRLTEPTSHPADQPVPGPAGRVPEDWESQLR